ncbi:hypothetical protein [Clostridium intestinale]|uniref:Uncharacterized protein n=1 Tax=Clostridium intestinale TaxID=36845 RepID=A0A7D6VQ37_9CLOT|nr:hypothetical protein [Clostridium intestinale]QLY78197.1 hypothetical protein HZF06_13985 [Clostridium intestinale]
MGKFKERYIEKSNQKFNEDKNKIDFDVKKITVALNGEEVLLEDYLKVVKGNIYVVAPKDNYIFGVGMSLENLQIQDC